MRKVVIVADGSLTMAKLNAEDAQKVLARLEAYDAKITYIQDQKGWSRAQFVEFVPQVEKLGPEAFPVNEEVLKEAEDAEVILANFSPIGSKVMDAGKSLKFIGVTRSGAENVNVKYAREQGINVSVSPGRLSDPVSDYTVGMLLAESRNIARASITDHNGQWITAPSPNAATIRSLNGATVGVIGFGLIGRKVAKKLQAFGCNIVAYDPFCTAESAEAVGAKLIPLKELMRVSDFVTVHARLSKETEGLVSKEMIDRMKPSAVFVNTARAGLVDENALVKALQENRIAGAALDVFVEEPLQDDHPLKKLKNVTLTPHLAGNVSNIAAISLDIIVSELECYFKGEPLHNSRI